MPLCALSVSFSEIKTTAITILSDYETADWWRVQDKNTNTLVLIANRNECRVDFRLFRNHHRYVTQYKFDKRYTPDTHTQTVVTEWFNCLLHPESINLPLGFVPGFQRSDFYEYHVGSGVTQSASYHLRRFGWVRLLDGRKWFIRYGSRTCVSLLSPFPDYRSSECGGRLYTKQFTNRIRKTISCNCCRTVFLMPDVFTSLFAFLRFTPLIFFR